MKQVSDFSLRERFANGIALFLLALVLPVSASAQSYSVSSARPATIESIREVVQQNSNPSGLGLVAGGLIGGGLGSLIGSGTGRTVATVVGAVGGGYVGHNLEKFSSRSDRAGRRQTGGSSEIVRTSAAEF